MGWLHSKTSRGLHPPGGPKCHVVSLLRLASYRRLPFLYRRNRHLAGKRRPNLPTSLRWFTDYGSGLSDLQALYTCRELCCLVPLFPLVGPASRCYPVKEPVMARTV